MPSRIRTTLVLASLLFADPREASACSCNLNPPCAAFWRADAVFIGRVTAAETIQAEGQSPEIVTAFTVLRTFRGEPLPTMVLRAVLTSCVYGFRIGETYLVYAFRGADGRFATGQCSGTKPLAEADEDIAMIQTLPARSPLGWIYGTVHRAVRDPETHRLRDGLAAGVPVTLSARGTLATTLTDQDGRFEFAGLSPGTYAVDSSVPATMRVYGGTNVAVTARACAPVHLQMVNRARVSGRLYLPDGSAPPRGIPIELRDVDATGTALEPVRRSEFSNAEGRFQFDQVEPGRYYLGMNTEYPPTADRPYAPRFYPNANDSTAAYVIEVGDGEQKTGFDFTLLGLSDEEVAAAAPRRSVVAAPPVEPPPQFSPQLFPRRRSPPMFPFPVKGGLVLR